MSDVATSQSGAGVVASNGRMAGLTPPANPTRHGTFLSDVIVELGFATPEDIERAEQAGRQSGQSIERFLLESGILDEVQLSRAVAERNGLDHVDLDLFEVDMGVAEMITRSAAERYCAVPIATAADGALLVAVKDPVDSLGMSDIEVMTRSEVRRVIAPASEIERLVQQLPVGPRIKWSPPPPEDAQEAEGPEAENTDGLPEAQETPATEPQAPAEEQTATVPRAPTAEEQGATEPQAPTAEQAQSTSDVQAYPEAAPHAEPTPPASPQAPPASPQAPPAPPLPPAAFQPGPVAPDGSLGELGTELQALQETVRRADDLAGAVSRRIEELEGAGDRVQRADERAEEAEERANQAEERANQAEARANQAEARAEQTEARTDETEALLVQAGERADRAEARVDEAEQRSQRLEQELVATQERVTELQQRLSGVDSAVEDVREATEKLGAVRKALEASVQPPPSNPSID
jgi:hypothetical protein